jgi:hypothetical protein
MARWLRGVLILAAAGMIPACGSKGDTFTLNVLPVPTSGTILYIGPGTPPVLINVSPSAPNVILSAIGLKNLQPLETLKGLDYRPASGELFAFGSSKMLYRIDPQTGECTAIGPFIADAIGASFGLDVDPVDGRIRLLGDTNENLSLDPNGGPPGIDPALAYGTAQDPNIVACAYIHGGAILYAIDSTLDILVTVAPGTGMLTSVGPLGLDVSGAAGFDITAANIAYAALEVGGVTSLYMVNLGTGQAILQGTLGTGGPVQGFTLVP